MTKSTPPSQLPTNIDEVRALIQSINWNKIREDVAEETNSRIAIVGPVNSGKSTLFNLLKGQEISPISPVAGTTRTVIKEDVGPFTLLDTPGFSELGGQDRAQLAMQAVEQSTLLILVLDAAAGLRQSDFDLFTMLHQTGKPVIVVLNKIDLVKANQAAVTTDFERKLGVPVIPISAKEGTNVASMLIPKMIEEQPAIAVAIGRELPQYRRMAAGKIVRQAAFLNAAAAIEPIPLLDIPILLSSQVRMVLRIAAIYGESMNATHARELISTIAGGLFMRYLSGEAAKLLPGPGWLLNSAMAAAGTYAIGQAAVEYFESGKTLSTNQLKQVYENARKTGSRLFNRGKKP